MAKTQQVLGDINIAEISSLLADKKVRHKKTNRYFFDGQKTTTETFYVGNIFSKDIRAAHVINTGYLYMTAWGREPISTYTNEHFEGKIKKRPELSALAAEKLYDFLKARDEKQQAETNLKDIYENNQIKSK